MVILTSKEGRCRISDCSQLRLCRVYLKWKFIPTEEYFDNRILTGIWTREGIRNNWLHVHHSRHGIWMSSLYGRCLFLLDHHNLLFLNLGQLLPQIVLMLLLELSQILHDISFEHMSCNIWLVGFLSLGIYLSSSVGNCTGCLCTGVLPLRSWCSCATVLQARPRFI